MNEYPAAELSNDSPNPEQLARHELESFVLNPGLEDLANIYGLTIEGKAVADRLAETQDLATKNWDFRRGAERQAVAWGEGDLGDPDSAVGQKIFAAANKLKMVESSKPQNQHPSLMVVLGGANRAPLDRLRYGLESVEDAGAVVYLGSSRLISDSEREKAKDYAPDAETEFDLGSGAIETLLGAKRAEGPEVYKLAEAGDEYKVRTFVYEKNGETRYAYACSTPQNIGERRATTYDNYDFLAEWAQLDEVPGASVVAVTTGFYVPAQHMPAVQELTLRHGVPVETIGHDAAYAGNVRRPSQLLQEAKSALDAATRLQDALSK